MNERYRPFLAKAYDLIESGREYREDRSPLDGELLEVVGEYQGLFAEHDVAMFETEEFKRLGERFGEDGLGLVDAFASRQRITFNHSTGLARRLLEEFTALPSPDAVARHADRCRATPLSLRDLEDFCDEELFPAALVMVLHHCKAVLDLDCEFVKGLFERYGIEAAVVRGFGEHARAPAAAS